MGKYTLMNKLHTLLILCGLLLLTFSCSKEDPYVPEPEPVVEPEPEPTPDRARTGT